MTYRFITEYANYKKRHINEDMFLRDDLKAESVARINHVLTACRRGYITLDETMMEIAKA